MKILTFITSLLITTFIFVLPAKSQWAEQEKLTASDGLPDDTFGAIVAISGNKAIVAHRTNDSEGLLSGSAYIFEKNTTGWHETAQLIPASLDRDDVYGWSASISGNFAVVGAPLDQASGFKGAVFIFEKTATGWIEIQKLTAPDGRSDDWFGGAVSISGNRIIVGAPNHYNNSVEAGKAYIFEKDPKESVWILVATLVAHDGDTQYHFGKAVGIIDDQAVVSAESGLYSPTRSGSIYVFKKNPTDMGWFETNKFTGSDAHPGDSFGSSVAITNNKIITGAPYNNHAGEGSGKAYIFEKDETVGWHESAILTTSDAAAEDFFGGSVSISDNWAIVGTSGDDDLGTSSGSAYIFEKNVAGNWLLNQKITASDGATSDSFGGSVGISGNTAIIGAPGDDDLGDRSGSAYIFEFSSLPPVADCPFAGFPGINNSGNPLGLLDYLCFQIDYKIIKNLNECQYCHFEPCSFCPSPCITCTAPFKEFGYAYEVTFSYENPLEKTLEVPYGKQNYFANVQDGYVGQPVKFEPGLHKNVFSIIAAPGQNIQWELMDSEGNKRSIAFQMPMDLNVKIYPNPNNGVFQLAIGSPTVKKEKARITLYQAKSKQPLLQGNITLPYKNEVDIRKFGKGIFLLKVDFRKSSVTEKILVE